METRHKAYKFRMYTNEEQKVLIAKTFGCVRFGMKMPVTT